MSAEANPQIDNVGQTQPDKPHPTLYEMLGKPGRNGLMMLVTIRLNGRAVGKVGPFNMDQLAYITQQPYEVTSSPWKTGPSEAGSEYDLLTEDQRKLISEVNNRGEKISISQIAEIIRQAEEAVTNPHWLPPTRGFNNGLFSEGQGNHPLERPRNNNR